jgi:hypothetical protein
MTSSLLASSERRSPDLNQMIFFTILVAVLCPAILSIAAIAGRQFRRRDRSGIVAAKRSAPVFQRIGVKIRCPHVGVRARYYERPASKIPTPGGNKRAG